MNILSDDDFFILKSRLYGQKFVNECYKQRVWLFALSNTMSLMDYIINTNRTTEWHKHAIMVDEARRIRQNIRKINDASV